MIITGTNTTNNSIDLSYLPSVVMQTTAALYGIFIAIFVLTFQSFSKYKNDIKSENEKKTEKERKEFEENFSNKISSFKNYFVILAYFVVTFILFNGLLVYFLSYSTINFYFLFFASFVFFIIVVVYIIGFSYYLISFLISLETDEPDFTIWEILNKKYNFNFYNVLVIISVFFCLMAFFYYQVVTESSIYIFIVLSLILLAIIYLPSHLKKKKGTEHEQNVRIMRSKINRLENDLQKIKSDIEKLIGNTQIK